LQERVLSDPFHLYPLFAAFPRYCFPQGFGALFYVLLSLTGRLHVSCWFSPHPLRIRFFPLSPQEKNLALPYPLPIRTDWLFSLSTPSFPPRGSPPPKPKPVRIAVLVSDGGKQPNNPTRKGPFLPSPPTLRIYIFSLSADLKPSFRSSPQYPFAPGEFFSLLAINHPPFAFFFLLYNLVPDQSALLIVLLLSSLSPPVFLVAQNTYPNARGVSLFPSVCVMPRFFYFPMYPFKAPPW